MSMDDRPKALDDLLAHVADNLPDEEAATSKARAVIAPLEKKIREAKAQERAEIRSAAIRQAIDLAREEGHRLEEVAGIAHARGARSVAYLLRKLAAKERPVAVDTPAAADTTGIYRVPVARSVVYIVRSAPEVPDEYNETRTIAPTEITLTYRATPDSQLGRVHAYVKGWWMHEGARVHAEAVGRHFTGDPSEWPDWLTAEARLHDPDTADQEQRNEEQAQAHLDLVAEQPPAMDLLQRAESYLSALHGSVGRHDNLAENLGCAGCQLRDQLRAELRRLARPGSDPS